MFPCSIEIRKKNKKMDDDTIYILRAKDKKDMNEWIDAFNGK